MSSIYLSIVATSRNDDHGGRLLDRMQIFINGVVDQCKRFSIPAELIMVEWNPPSERPGLLEALKWPQDPDPCEVRIIQVPPEIHRRFKHSERLPIYQMIAKNVGIRRARGEYVLATNIDLLFSDELMHFFSARRLQPGRFYRIDRYDVDRNVPVEVSVEEQLEYCGNHVIRIYSRDSTVNTVTNDSFRIYSPLHSMPGKVHAALTRLMQAIPKNWVPLWFKEHARLYTRKKRLHTNASGDFTLMSREHWFELRGYPELEMFSFHLDSFLCYMAHYHSLKEVILEPPMKLYHIDHTQGWTPEVEKDQSLNQSLASAGIPQLSHVEFNLRTVEMARERRPMILNNENWGLAHVDLPETNVCLLKQ